VTIQIWHHFVHGLIATNRYFPSEQLLLLDGIPRTLRQAELLEKYITVERVIVLDVENTDVLVKRIQRRALLERRLDDKDPEVLKTRMEVYKRETTQLLKHYPHSLLSHFNADQKPLKVLRDILVSLSDLLST
jgi:adenylate kinase